MILNLKCYVFFLVLLLLILNMHITSAVIYSLNDTEYKKMPPIFHVDPYQECMQSPDGLYCTTELLLVSDEYSPLLNVILEYSAHKTTRYNHSLLRYNLCISRTCKDFYDNTTTDLAENLEACLNKTFQDNYGLKTRVLDNLQCQKANEETKTELADLCMFSILLVILILNAVGSIYYWFWKNGENAERVRFLTYFDIRRNWRKLIAPALEDPDSRLDRLKGLNGLKCATTISAIIIHSEFPKVFYIDNTMFVEDLYNNIGMHALLNGTTAVQTFFIISGFLLAYNLEMRSEKNTITVKWGLLPKRIILRWISLTPVNALVLFFTVTCNKYLVTGPFVHTLITSEVEDCKLYWWQHLLYINNYNELSQCMMHTWYLASDAQLYCLGLIVYIVCRTAVSRKVVLSLLLVVALVIPAVHTYVQDLDGTILLSPEDFSHFFVTNRTFRKLYKLGHTNMFSYLVGLIVGLMAYHGQKVNYDVQRLRKYCILYYAMLPLGLAMFLTGTIFFREGPRPSMAVRIFFAVYQKPVWCMFIGMWILGFIFKYENFVRGMMEWRGWTALSRLSYCVYMVHVTVIRLFCCLRESTTHFTVLSLIEEAIFIVLVSYLVALLCWVLVEQPFGQLLKMFFSPPPKATADADKGV